MQREIKKKNMYQAASFTGDLGEARFLLALRGRAGSGSWQGGCVRDRHRTS
jgi:hypothetical protein